MGGEKKVSRRAFIGTIAGAAVAAGVAGYVGGFLTAPREVVTPAPAAAPGVASPPPVQEAAPTVTVTQTVTETAPPVTVTETVTAPEVAKPITVGNILQETGLVAADGIGGLRAFTMAMEEWEAIFGRLPGNAPSWRSVNVDTPNLTTEEAVGAIRRLATVENVDIIIAGYPTVDATEYDEAAKYDLYYVNHDTSGLGEQKLLAAGWRNFQFAADTIPPWPDYKYWQCFEGTPFDSDQAKQRVMMINAWVESGQWKPINQKYALIEIASPYGLRQTHPFDVLMRLLGWQPTFKEVIPFGTVEWGPILAKLRADPPAYIFSTDFIPSDAAAFIKQFREEPIPSLVDIDYAPGVGEFVRLAGEDSVGVVWPQCRSLLHDDPGWDFTERYTARWGEAPNLANSPQLYDFTYTALVAGMAAGGWGRETSRRMAALFNSRVTFAHSDFVLRGLGGMYSYRPGQTARPWPLEEPLVDIPAGGPLVSFQMKARGGLQKELVRMPGKEPTQLIVGPSAPVTFWHEVKVGIDETPEPFYSPISKSIMEADPTLYHIAGNYPFSANVVDVPFWGDENLEPPPWLEEVKPATWAKVKKY